MNLKRINHMKDYFKELFEYNHHFNQRLVGVVQVSEERLPKRCLEVFSHILNAHHIWNKRILGQKPLHAVWAIIPTDELKAIDKDNFHTSIEIIANSDFDRVINYATSQKQPFSNSVKDILFHVINHSTYHKGQIAIYLRESGIPPELSDFIFYKRG